MYVAVKGGERAIANAHALLAKRGRGDTKLPEIDALQVAGQLSVLVSRVMAEGSLYDPQLAARAIVQAQGDALEAITLVRSYRTTLPRFGVTQPVDTAGLPPQRRISATFKDLPGGQQLGATFDYTHRLFKQSESDHPHDTERLNGGRDYSGGERAAADSEWVGAVDDAAELSYPPALLDPSQTGVGVGTGSSAQKPQKPQITSSDPYQRQPSPDKSEMPRITELLGSQSLLEPDPASDGDPEPADLTRDPTIFPMSRAERLQALARGDEGFLLSLAYSTQRGYGGNHPFAGEIRTGDVEVEFEAPELGFAVPMGRLEVTECQMVNQFKGSAEAPAQFTRGYGLVFGRGERKAMSMSIVDRALRSEELGERRIGPGQDEEFVISHADNVQAAGFVEHLKLPHYVDFQAELGLVRRLRGKDDE